MKILYFDLEATDKDPRTARPLEYCFRLVDHPGGLEKVAAGFLWEEDFVIHPEAQKIHGLSPEFLRKTGTPVKPVLDALVATLPSIDLVVGHNCRSYDLILLEAECARWGLTLPKVRALDSRYDLPFPEKMNCRKLTHLCLDHGIEVDVSKAHGAKYDVDLMKQLVEKYDINEVLAILTSPLCLVKAHVTYDERELAKARGFRWEKVDGHTVSRTWIKEIRKAKLEAERAAVEFHISVLKEMNA